MAELTVDSIPESGRAIIEAQENLQRRVLEKVAQDPDFARKVIAAGQTRDLLAEAGLGDALQRVEQAVEQRLSEDEVSGHSGACGYVWSATYGYYYWTF